MLPKNGSTLNSVGSNPNMPFRPITISSTPTRRSTQVNMLFSDRACSIISSAPTVPICTREKLCPFLAL